MPQKTIYMIDVVSPVDWGLCEELMAALTVLRVEGENVEEYSCRHENERTGNSCRP